jgi:hypothetical protein
MSPKDHNEIEISQGDNSPRADSGRAPVSRVNPVFFCLLLSTLVILFGGYAYGTRDHIEQLPMVFRHLDPSYCTNDFFVNASMDFGPRFYYVRFLSLLGSFLNLPMVFLALTWLCNFGIALVTYSAAKRFFEDSDLVAMVACTLVMGAPGITLGGVFPLAQTYLIPSGLACTFALACLWAGLAERPVLAAVLIVAVCPIHPQVSLEVGAIALATAGISAVIFRNTDRSSGQASRTRQGVHTLVGCVILAISIAAFWLPGAAPKNLEVSEFIQILAYFRHPHHFVPSTWGLTLYLWSAGFLTVFAVSWHSWRRNLSHSKILAHRILICVSIVLLLWCGGYLFVEIWPSRWWTTAQAFRLGFIVNWVGFLVIAGAIASVYEKTLKRYRAHPLLSSGTGAPEKQLHNAASAWVTPGSAALEATLLLVCIASGIILAGRWRLWDSWLYLIVPAITVWLLFYLTIKQRTETAVLLISFWLIALAVGRHPEIPDIRSVTGRLGPAVTLADTEDPTLAVAAYARENTPEDAVFLTPPGFGRFRLTARRSIVVDFKAFPFQDSAIREWKERLDNCYGRVESWGFPAMREMEENYRRIDERKILALRRLYNISYAVLRQASPQLHQQTEVDFPILYSGNSYRLVKVPPFVEADSSHY